MNRTAALIALGLSLGVVLGTITGNPSNAQPSPVTRTMLQQKDIEGMPGKEAIVYVADFTPAAASGRHFHPGPEVGYVLQGTLVIEPDGHAPLTLRPGESFHNPSRHVHNARNASPSDPAKVLVFLIGDKGQPLATPAP
jgi:quercetin dioxygenase-like cupin family protein